MESKTPGSACATRQAETLDELLEATRCPLQAADGTTCVSDCPHLRLVRMEGRPASGRVQQIIETYNCAAPVRGGNGVVGVPIGSVAYRFTEGGVPLGARKAGGQ